MNVLITGPFGTIGSRVLTRLRESGNTVTCLDLDTRANRRKAAALPSSVRVVYGDVTNRAAVAEVVRGQQAIVHLAAILPPFSEARPALAEQVNVVGTRNVLEAVASEAPSAKLVFASSISVHGLSVGRDPPCRVDAPFDGRDHYARHKITCEQMVRASGTRAVILRIGACAGPDDVSKGGDRAQAMATMFAIAPDTRVEYLHPEDAAVAIANACSNDEAVGKSLFLGSGKDSQLLWRDFVSTFPRALGLGDFPVEAFGNEPFYTDWMDTSESERLLRYQRHGYPAYAAAIEHRLRWAKLALTRFRSLARSQLLRTISRARAQSEPLLAR